MEGILNANYVANLSLPIACVDYDAESLKMPRIESTCRIFAPQTRVFDLARSIDLHCASQQKTREEAVAGRITGLIELHESVTWRATHFGVRQELTSRIIAFERPHHFCDEMVSGAFASFRHDHFFEADGEHTLMRDIFEYASPFGLLGRLVDALILERYLKRFISEKANHLKQVAESESWQKFLPTAG